MSITLRPSRAFAQLTDEELTDVAKLEQVIIDTGITGGTHVPDYHNECHYFMALQHPIQLAQLFAYLAQSKLDIRSYLELGTRYGGGFYLIDSFLRRINPNYEGSVGVDITTNMWEVDIYKKHFQNVEIIKSDVMKWDVSRKFDFIFIDDDHTRPHIDKEFEKYKHFCNKIMAWHDVNEIPDVVSWWQEVKQRYPHQEFIRNYDTVDVLQGIGLIHLS